MAGGIHRSSGLHCKISAITFAAYTCVRVVSSSANFEMHPCRPSAYRSLPRGNCRVHFSLLPCSIPHSFMAAPHNSARSLRQDFCSNSKFRKWRNTVCISHFRNCGSGAKRRLRLADAIVRCCLINNCSPCQHQSCASLHQRSQHSHNLTILDTRGVSELFSVFFPYGF